MEIDQERSKHKCWTIDPKVVERLWFCRIEKAFLILAHIDLEGMLWLISSNWFFQQVRKLRHSNK